MKNKKSLFRLLKVVLMALVLVAILPVSARAEDGSDISGGTVEAEGVTASKHVTVQEDGTYVIDLEAFSTGEVHFDEHIVPCDIILVLDTSSSMNQSMSSIVGYEQVTNISGNVQNSWSQNRNITYSYLGSDSEYHQITIYRTESSSSSWMNRQYYFTIHVEGYSGDREYGPSGNLSLSNLRAAVRELTGQSDAELYTVVTENITRLKALQNAVNAFLGEVANNNAEVENPADYSKVSIVTFNETSSVITGSKAANANSFVGVQWNSDKTKVMSTETTPTDMNNLVNTMPVANWTYTHLGMNNATSILDDLGTSTERKHIVVLFTDGVPCNSGSGDTFNYQFATSVINSAHDIKDPEKYAATMFTIAVYPGADPTVDPTTATGTANATLINKLLHAASSNFPTASATGNMNITFGTRDASAQHYFVPSSADELKDIFETIGKESAVSKSNLNATTVMKDIVSSSFSLPPDLIKKLDPEKYDHNEYTEEQIQQLIEQAIKENIHVYIIPWDSSNEVHNWSTTVKYTTDEWKTACLNYGAEAAENVEVNISDNFKTLDITGYDYATHFLATADPALDKDGVNDNAAKIYIYFEIDAKPSAITGGNVATNGPESGIYFEGKPVISFPLPQVKYTPVTYVVDYVTSDTSTDTKASSIKLDYSGVLKNVEMLDKPNDDVLKGEHVDDFKYTIYTGRYGTISFGDDEVDVQRLYVRYAPTTMDWNDYDRIFIKGESASSDDKDVWAMMAVIPANSVFYEDTYISQTKTVTYNGQDVDIVYTGINYLTPKGQKDENNEYWNTVGTEGTNQTYHAGDDMGWIDGLADDDTYANDMAHTANKSKARATFTFSGTGVDIYSRTNGSTGTINVNIKSAAEDNESGSKINKSKALDTKAAAGDFFAVPVCTFTDLPYGKYTVTIAVTTGGQSEGRYTFYLDGVRVYNPIKPLEKEDKNVQKMYGEKNLGAVFTEVRSMLGDGDAEARTALYLDEYTTSEIVSNVAAIQEAAQALAEAQQNRDAYVESTITPAKNAVSNEEYALSNAEAALSSAIKVYDAAVKAYNDAEEDGADEATLAELQATVNEKLAEKNDAQTAYDNALAHYNANINDLKAALNNAIEGKQFYDDAVNSAIAAYDEANDGVTVGYNNAELADYEKEGPKSEVYLDKSQIVAITIESGKYYYIGLRSFKGNEVTVEINGTKTLKLSHTTDLYYECTPDSGNTIVIKNTSTNGAILSITKLRTTGVGNTTSGAKLASTEETLAYVRSLANKHVSDYTGEVLTEEEAGIEEAVTEEVLDESDITIENPEPVEDETVTDEPAESEAAPAESVLSKLLSSFSSFFRRNKGGVRP